MVAVIERPQILHCECRYAGSSPVGHPLRNEATNGRLVSLNNDLVRRLAVSQARGFRQASFINELLIWKPVSFEVVTVPGGSITAHLGRSKLSWQSWVNLRRRLVSVGFVVSMSKKNQTVSLSFPEAGAQQ